MSDLLHLNAFLAACDPDEQKLLRLALDHCRDQKINFTVLRQVILIMLARSSTGLKAYAVLDALKLLIPGAVPQTVYRALHFLIEAGLIVKISSCQTFKLCPSTDATSSQALLVCPNCNQQSFITEKAFCDEFTHLLQRYAFSSHARRVEIVTLCNLCAPE